MTFSRNVFLTSPRLRGEVGDGAQRRLRVRGTLREFCSAESPPHPDPLPAGGERERARPFGMAEKHRC